MRYLCVHCDHRFEHEGDTKPRCPKCMRVHGIESLASSRAPAVKRGKAGVVGAIALLLCALGGAYWYWSKETPAAVEGDPELRPLSRSELTGFLRHLHADARDLDRLLEPDDAIEAFAKESAGSASTDLDKTRAVLRAIRARASKHAFVTWSLNEPRDTPVRTARRAFELVGRDEGKAKLYPLELAALMTAALRALDVPAMIVEFQAFPAQKSPPDSSGHLGYFGVGVYPGEPGHGAPQLFDPFGGRADLPAAPDFRVLTDVQAVGAAVNLRAMHLLVHESDAARAFEESTIALRLDPRSPTIHSVRGAILLATGGTNEGVREFESASEIRADAPRRNNLAGIYLVQGDLERADREVAAALELTPDFAAAHGTLAAIHLSRQEIPDAGRELERAQRLDPDLHTLPMLWANYYLATGDAEQGVTWARRAVERRPADLQALLMLARVYRQLGRFTEMRQEARAVMAQAPAAQRAQIAAVIERMLGPTALEEDEAAADTETSEEASEEDTAPATDSEFQLGGDSKLLGGGGSGAPRLGDDDLTLGGSSGSGGGGGLHLDLNP